MALRRWIADGGEDDEDAGAEPESDREPEEPEEPPEPLDPDEAEFGPLPHTVAAVSMFCLDQAFDGQSEDFLRPAFEAFPEKDFCVLTLPHEVRARTHADFGSKDPVLGKTRKPNKDQPWFGERKGDEGPSTE